MVASKTELRRAILSRRPLSSAGISSRLIELAERHRVIASYSPLPSEPDVSEFNDWVQATGRKLLLPAISGKQLTWAEPGQPVPGELGILKPAGQPAELAEASLIVVPAVAADRAGNRLGRGAGYYDRALSAASEAVLAAVIFDSELLAEIPAEPHDVPMTLVVSPQQTLFC